MDVIDGIRKAPITEEVGEQPHSKMHAASSHAKASGIVYKATALRTTSTLDFHGKMLEREKRIFDTEWPKYKRILQTDSKFQQRNVRAKHNDVAMRVYDCDCPQLNSFVATVKLPPSRFGSACQFSTGEEVYAEYLGAVN